MPGGVPRWRRCRLDIDSEGPAAFGAVGILCGRRAMWFAPCVRGPCLMSDAKPVLHICVTCRAGLPVVEGEPVLGRRMFDRAAAVIAGLADAPVVLHPVVCLGNCAQGCSAAVSQPGKWSYLLGHMTPDHAADLVAYGAAFAASENGTVWRSGRADSLRDAIVARIPGFGFVQKETA